MLLADMNAYNKCFVPESKGGGYSRSVVKPSHRDINSVFILVIASWSVVRRCPKKLSTSSMKIIAGCSL
jgi:hypothetical protein